MRATATRELDQELLLEPVGRFASWRFALAGIAELKNVASWVGGSLAPGTVVFTRGVASFFIVYYTALGHHLGSGAGRC